MVFPPYAKFGSWCPGELSQHCLAQNATIQPPTHTRPKLCSFLAAWWHHSTPVSSNLALSSAMVGLDYLDVHEKYFPACLRNHWLEDVARTVGRWCVTFFATFSTGLACSAAVEVLKISMHEAHVDAILQCQKIIAFWSNVQLLVGVERANLAMHWRIHIWFVFVCCNHPSTQHQTIPSQALASAAGRKCCWHRYVATLYGTM